MFIVNNIIHYFNYIFLCKLMNYHHRKLYHDINDISRDWTCKDCGQYYLAGNDDNEGNFSGGCCA